VKKWKKLKKHAAAGAFTCADHGVMLCFHTFMSDPAAKLQVDLESLIQERTRQLSQRIAELEKAHRIKDDFLATLSHELMNPLTAVIGWAHLLRAGSVPEPQVKRAIDAIYQSALAQRELIQDLLNVSRIVSGKLTLILELVDLAPIIQQTIDSLLPVIERKQLKLDVHLDCGIGPVSVDPVRFQQIIWNLLNNSVKFTPPGGSIGVRLKRDEAQTITSVSDTGEGIAPEFLPYVFDRFRQSDSSRSREHGGLGLGLSILRHLVELHGGTVSVCSLGRGHGSTFSVQIPILPAGTSRHLPLS
jgi:signal transduction histidine kinase